LDACCSTEGKTLLAHIQGSLLSAEIFVHHGQIISQQFSVKTTIPHAKDPCFHLGESKGLKGLVTTREPEAMAV